MKSRLFKNTNFPFLLWIGKNLDIYTVPHQHFKIQILNLWMSWENLCVSSNFTVENKMGDSHKRRWSHFKLNIDGGDIPFLKILRIYQWIGKNIFHWGRRKDFAVIQKVYLLKTSNFWPAPPLFIPVHFTGRILINFLTMFFTQIYLYTITTIKIFIYIYIFIYKKNSKKSLRFFHKTFRNYPSSYYKELCLLFEKSSNFFHRVSIEIRLTPSVPLFKFIHSLGTPSPHPQQTIYQKGLIRRDGKS